MTYFPIFNTFFLSLFVKIAVTLYISPLQTAVSISNYVTQYVATCVAGYITSFISCFWVLLISQSLQHTHNRLLPDPYFITLHMNLSTFRRNMQTQAVAPLNYNQTMPVSSLALDIAHPACNIPETSK
jgi:hypothetical protein